MLQEDLKGAIQGQVSFDAAAKALYATDASNYRQVPIGVITPRTIQDVVRAFEICKRYDAPILSRGGGTSLAGQCCNEAVILDFSRHLNHILEIDPKGRTATVEPGVVLDSLRKEAEKYGLTFGPDPASHSRCTLGGMLGNNSCGVHAVAWGKTVDNVESLQILTYDGLVLDVGPTSPEQLADIMSTGGRKAEIYTKLKSIRDRYADRIRARFPKIPRRVSGYNLDELLPENNFNVARALVGTEGTCVSILKAKLKLIPSPPYRVLLVLGFASVYEAAESSPALLEYKPIGLEGFDVQMVDGLRRYQGYEGKIKRLPEGQAWLLVEFGGQTMEEAISKAKSVPNKMNISALVCDAPTAADIWRIRESALAATAFIPGQRDRYEGWEDAAVPPAKLASYLYDLRALYERFGYHGAFYGHFGDGCVHTRIDFDLDSQKGIQDFRRFLDEAADLVVRYGGSLSGEHGDGQARAELFPKMFGPELMEAFREFKAVWDPQNRMNPGKIVQPKRITDNLRYGLAFRPQKVGTYFSFPDDHNRFDRAAMRCVGVGQCRREEGGTMCPSYRATREEKHSTRGRAHLLFEMLKGETIKEGWKSDEVKDALDLCLSCKGCKSDCPTNVDMASYKAEFLAHYYEGRLRPRHAYAFGLVHEWAKIGGLAPRLANAMLKIPGMEGLAKFAADMAPDRAIPQLAPVNFRQWFKLQQLGSDPILKRGNASKLDLTPAVERNVLLWPDTFTNYFHPQIGQAAAQSLSRLGFHVMLPPAGLCCGRPLYDYGFLNLAKKRLQDVLTAMRPHIEAGTILVVLEPSCGSVFREELMNFFPKDPLAKRLSQQTLLLSEFIAKNASSLPASLKTAPKKGILQTHCHHKSIFGEGPEIDLLKRLGIDVQIPEPGCCGMAGAFGFESDHKEISLAIGEQNLIPAVANASEETLIIANGFSCREQVAQATGRRPLHLAEVLYRALQG